MLSGSAAELKDQAITESCHVKEAFWNENNLDVASTDYVTACSRSFYAKHLP